MEDANKTKAQLIDELAVLRRRLAELETCQIELDLAKGQLRWNKDDHGTRQDGPTLMLALLERTPHPIVLLDGDGGFAFCNGAAQELLVCSRHEPAGRSIGDLDATDGCGGLVRRFRRLWDTGGTLEAEWRVGEECRTIEFTMTPVLWNGDQAMLSAARDVTDKRLVERRLEEALAELDQFAYMASHDLREPLRAVTSYVELLSRRYQGKLDADANDFINFAVDGATRMQHLIDDLLAYSRVGTHGKPFRPVDCEVVFSHAMANLAMAIEECHAHVTHDPLPTVMADGTQLVRLFQNLLDNAIKFRRVGSPRVHVSYQENDADWVFCVSDHGIGIDARDAERIFAVSQRLHTRAEYPGTGFGLAICKKIVERHGGRIWVASEPNRGSRFWFTIPNRGGNQA